uniref:TIL domain-containing protein n=1 Tax=Panagrolaimus davidi TaxID=227884 RepID=A0A914QJH8_9BILA
MSVKFVVIFIGILFISVKSQITDSPSSNISEGPKECGKNEEWQECGSTCPPSCPRRWPPLGPGPICTEVCNPSCQCRKGFVRSFNGKCIRPKDCPKISLPMQPQPKTNN